MKRWGHMVLLAAMAAMPAGAQMAGGVSSYDRAPWWMRESVIVQTGFVYTEMPANHAAFDATFTAVDDRLDAAQSAATARMLVLQQALARLGADRVGTSVDVGQRVLYEQYRDKDGNKIENKRGDKVNGYEVSVTLSVEVRDISRLEAAYALVMASAPTSVTRIDYELNPSGEDEAWLYDQAVRDAGERARAVTAAAGAGLGRVETVDPEGRACRGDVMARNVSTWDKTKAQPVAYRNGTPAIAPQPVTPPPAGAAPAAGTVEALEARARENPFVQTAPLRRLEARTCVVYGLK